MMRIKVTDIDWCVEEEDVYEMFDCEPTDEQVEEKILEIKNALPKEAVVEVDDLDEIADALSDEFGWLVNDFEYKPAA